LGLKLATKNEKIMGEVIKKYNITEEDFSKLGWALLQDYTAALKLQKNKDDANRIDIILENEVVASQLV
jgi:hypothetical protein